MYTHRTKHAGFTLVEILVVFVIIGVITSVTIASIQASRNNADDRFIQEQLGVIRLDAEFSYKEHSKSYSDVCNDVQTDFNLIDSPDKTCIDGLDGYAVSIELSDGTFYCTDSSRTRGMANLSTSTIASSGDCLSTNTTDCICG